MSTFYEKSVGHILYNIFEAVKQDIVIFYWIIPPCIYIFIIFFSVSEMILAVTFISCFIKHCFSVGLWLSLNMYESQSNHQLLDMYRKGLCEFRKTFSIHCMKAISRPFVRNWHAEHMLGKCKYSFREVTLLTGRGAMEKLKAPFEKQKICSPPSDQAKIYSPSPLS